MNVTATTFPRRSRRDIRAPSCVVSVNTGAGPILGRPLVPPAAWPTSGAAQPLARSRTTIVRHHPRRLFTPTLQLLLELVEEAPVAADCIYSAPLSRRRVTVE